MKYWVNQDNEPKGPYDPEELLRLPGFSLDSWVCPQGATSSKAWRKAQDVAELAERLKKVSQPESSSGACEPPMVLDLAAHAEPVGPPASRDQPVSTAARHKMIGKKLLFLLSLAVAEALCFIGLWRFSTRFRRGVHGILVQKLSLAFPKTPASTGREDLGREAIQLVRNRPLPGGGPTLGQRLEAAYRPFQHVWPWRVDKIEGETYRVRFCIWEHQFVLSFLVKPRENSVMGEDAQARAVLMGDPSTLDLVGSLGKTAK